ncbi:MAG: putative oxidoreductase C-terminal domain-containing protein [Flavobacteriaceae bacterium]
MKYSIFFMVLIGCLSCSDKKRPMAREKGDTPKSVKLMTLDPGHFHAALVHKSMYPTVDSTIDIYASDGPEVKDFLDKIKGYNHRRENPTDWKVSSHLGPEYLKKMIDERPGNVMIVAGKNSKKIDYILAAVEAGLHVYADKPLVINPEGYKKLKRAFEIANENGVLIYDIMTERFEATTAMQKFISTLPEVFGTLVQGTLEEPAISKESVHHFSKMVSGKPLIRPAWFFDVNEEGEGTVDVTTHLVDLIQWEAFPGQIIDTIAIEMLVAKRWPTKLSKEQFQSVTGYNEFPSYLQSVVDNEHLKVFCNGEMHYKINGKHAKVSVSWSFKAPEGTGDTHYSIMRGSKCDLIIKQGEEEAFKPVLYLQPKAPSDFLAKLEFLELEIEKEFPASELIQASSNLWRVVIPEELKVGHEAHFAQVTQNYLSYLNEGQLPAWEQPNMISKYYTTTKAYQMSQESQY